jgi:hypothetical protein
MVVRACNSSTLEAEAGGSFETSIGFLVKPCLQEKKDVFTFGCFPEPTNTVYIW